ncbi:MAG: A/G-specific adenine glycosylase [Bacteroidota bacterium]
MLNDFAKCLIKWYEANARNLPWRNTKDPYLIWLSEILLQQTRVEQGLPYYEKFVSAYPSVQHLANAREEEVLKLWEGLGYYSRARNMLHAAKYIVNSCGAVFPDSSKELSRLKGVGPYTAAAIASFAFDEVIPVLDGNVIRVSSRLLACSEDVTKGKTQAVLKAYLNAQIPDEAPALFNQAMMELGALVCKPGKPDCVLCPVSDYCQARACGIAAKLPLKAPKPQPASRYFHYFHLIAPQHTWLKRRPAGDIWQGLFEFPMHETDAHSFESWQLPQTIMRSDSQTRVSLAFECTHRLTHQIIHARFWKIYVQPEQIFPEAGIFECAHEQVAHHALHRLMLRYLEHQHTETES